MDEIKVVVSQEPGKISWNYDEIKKMLEVEMERYSRMVYTDENIGDAKKDAAYLRKLCKAIGERKTEIRKKCLEPFGEIEKQAEELIGLIDKPLEMIDRLAKDYEQRRRATVREKINAYFGEKALILPESIREKAKAQIYDSRWENATATQKSWKDGISSGIQKIVDEIETIKSFSGEFEQDAMEVYFEKLSLPQAIYKMNSMKAQKERILETERLRKEKEERETREKIVMQERLRKEQEEASITQMAAPNIRNRENAVISGMPDKTSGKQINVGFTENNIPNIRENEKNGMADISEYPQKASAGGIAKTIRIIGTQTQIQKIEGYIKFIGADWQEVQ